MRRTAKLVVAVLAGASVWAVLWIAGTLAVAFLLPDRMIPETPVTDTAVLVLDIAYSVVLSILAGYIAARLGSMQAAWWLAGLQLVLGIAIEASAWGITPVWYHLIFLALLVPATIAGARLWAPGGVRTAGVAGVAG